MAQEKGRSGSDRVLLALLFLINIASAYTTVLGARQVLPQPMSDVLGLAVQAMLFLLLAGWAAKRAVLRKWFVVGVFALASVYTSFFAYYETLAGDAVQAETLERAHQAHASFVSTVYQPALSRIGQLEQEAAQLYDMAEREGAQGLTTGQVGFGPVARAYAAEAAAKEREVALLRADLERMQHRFEVDTEGLSATALYQSDLATWQLAPDAWKSATPAPARAAYIDTEHDVALLAPFHKVRRAEAPAIAAMLLALLVDGIAIMLGTAIEGSRGPVVDRASRGAARVISQVKDGQVRIRQAMERPGLEPPVAEPALARVAHAAPMPTAVGDLSDPVQVVVLRVAGRGSDFLSHIYQAIHPVTGGIDVATLQAHESSTWRIASRMLLDRLRRPQLGWVVIEDGLWKVPARHYAQVTWWLGDHIRLEVEAEAAAEAVLEGEEVPAPERTMRLLLPAVAA